MSFTQPEHRSMLERAHQAIDRRDHRRAIRHRASLVAALALAVCAAAILWWPRETAPPANPIQDSQLVSAAPPQRPTSTPSPPPPPWLEIITSDEDIEAGFAEAGECARVVRVDHKIFTIACSELPAQPRILEP